MFTKIKKNIGKLIPVLFIVSLKIKKRDFNEEIPFFGICSCCSKINF